MWSSINLDLSFYSFAYCSGFFKNIRIIDPKNARIPKIMNNNDFEAPLLSTTAAIIFPNIYELINIAQK